MVTFSVTFSASEGFDRETKRKVHFRRGTYACYFPQNKLASDSCCPQYSGINDKNCCSLI